MTPHFKILFFVSVFLLQSLQVIGQKFGEIDLNTELPNFSPAASVYTFTPTKSVSLLSPNGGEYLAAGTHVKISWTSSDVSLLKIEISYDSLKTWSVIRDSINSTVKSYHVKVPEIMSKKAFIRLSDSENPTSVADTSNSRFYIITESQTVIVILGASTARGTGASVIDSSWAGRYRARMLKKDSTSLLINLAVGGFTTYDVMPDGFLPPANRPIPKTFNNITRALSYLPDAIIVNIPGNDVAYFYTFDEQVNNFDSISVIAARFNVPIWFTTTQPRNLSDEQRELLKKVKNHLIDRFKENCIDFWTEIAAPEGTIYYTYNSGDGIHLNDAAHRILYHRVLEKNILGFDVPVSVQPDQNKVPESFRLEQNYPNPFNPSTALRYELFENGVLNVKLFDVLGRELRTVVSGQHPTGRYTLTIDGHGLRSGIYFLTAEFKTNSGVTRQSKKIVLLR